VRRFLPFFLSPFIAAAIGPCTAASQAAESAVLPEQPLEGVLTTEGVECPTLRGRDGRLYTLMGDLHGFKPHDHVCIVPDYIEMTYCMQGTTAHVDWIGASCPGR